MKKILCLLLAFMVIGPLYSQYSEEEVSVIVSQGWDYITDGRQIDSAFSVVQKLEKICADQGSEKACLNMLQLKAEHHFFSSSLDSAVYWYKRGLEESEALGNENEAAYCAGSLGGVYSSMGRNREALEQFQKALDYRVQVNDTSGILYILMRRAWMQVDSEQMDGAMQDCVSVLKYAEASKDHFNVGRIYGCMSVIFEKQKQLEKAIEYQALSSAKYKEVNYEEGAVANKVNMAIIMKDLGRYEEAFALYDEALVFFRETNLVFGILSVFTNRAVAANRSGDHKRALVESDSALKYAIPFKLNVAQSDNFNEKGIAYLALGDLEKALSFSQKAIDLLDSSSKSLEKRKNAEKTLSKIYGEQGDYKNALVHYKTFALLKDSIFESKRSNQMLRLEEQYESQKKQSQIEALNAARELEDTKKKAVQFGLIGVVLLSGVILNREYQRRKKVRALHVSELSLAESERTRLQDQLHFKNKELTAQALHIAQKNELFNSIKTELEEAKRGDEGDFARGMMHKINLDSQIDRNWDQFIQMFTETNTDFLQTISTRFPDVSKNELRLCALIKMNLTNKEIGTVLNISDDGVKKARYRLRKKMKLETNDSLEQVILTI